MWIVKNGSKLVLAADTFVSACSELWLHAQRQMEENHQEGYGNNVVVTFCDDNGMLIPVVSLNHSTWTLVQVPLKEY